MLNGNLALSSAHLAKKEEMYSDQAVSCLAEATHGRSRAVYGRFIRLERQIYVMNEGPYRQQGQSNMAGTQPGQGTALVADEHLIDLLRNGDKDAFVTLLDQYHPALLCHLGKEQIAPETKQKLLLVFRQ